MYKMGVPVYKAGIMGDSKRSALRKGQGVSLDPYRAGAGRAGKRGDGLEGACMDASDRKPNPPCSV
jgi:hypothetical protein